jgi:hypothetical protein
MLASLLNTPTSDQEWQRWSFVNSQDVLEIQQAIRSQLGVSLPQYILDPMPLDDTPRWLARNQEALDGINGVLKLQGADLEVVDLTDPRQLQGWMFTLYQQHYDARAALKI